MRKAEKAYAAEMEAKGWKKVPAAETAELVKAAREWVEAEKKAPKKKERQINMRYDEDTILLCQHRAALEGLPGYQTLIKSVLHRYLTGRLIDPSLMNKE